MGIKDLLGKLGLGGKPNDSPPIQYNIHPGSTNPYVKDFNPYGSPEDTAPTGLAAYETVPKAPGTVAHERPPFQEDRFAAFKQQRDKEEEIKATQDAIKRTGEVGSIISDNSPLRGEQFYKIQQAAAKLDTNTPNPDTSAPDASSQSNLPGGFRGGRGGGGGRGA